MMNLMEYLESKPLIIMAIVFMIASVLILILIFIMYQKLEDKKRITKAASELVKIANGIHAGLVHFILEDKCRILYASKGFYELVGYSKFSAKKDNKITLLDFIDSRDHKIFDEFVKCLPQSIINSEIRLKTKEGNTLYALMNGNSTIGKDGKHTFSVVIVDISEQKRMQNTILLESERYRIATELAQDILFEYDILKDEMVFTEKYKELFHNEATILRYFSSSNQRRKFVHPDDWGIYLEFCQDLSMGKHIIEAEFRMKDKIGDYIWCQVMGKTIYNDDKRPIRVIGRLSNVNTQKKELEALEFKATRDPLTGVYNKEVTIKKIEKFINGNRHSKHMLMFIDFDDFKKINDNYGHLTGDKILTYVVEKIREVFNEGEIIGRSGGDEFIVFCGNIVNDKEVLEKAEMLLKALDTTYEDKDQSISISGSIGIAVYPEDGLHFEQLMERADQALYYVKGKGKKNYMIYSPAI